MCGPNFGSSLNDVLWEIVSGIVSDYIDEEQKFTKKDVFEKIKELYPGETWDKDLAKEVLEEECERNEFFVS